MADPGDSGDRRARSGVLGVWFAISFAGAPWVVFVPAALLAVITGLVWLGVSAGMVAAARRWRAPMIGLVVIIVGIVGMQQNLPVRARFAASAAEFQAIVDAAGPPPRGDEEPSAEPPCPASIGTFAIDRCESVPGGYLFYDPLGSGLVDWAGFAYLPYGPLPDTEYTSEMQDMFHLQGHWYAFWQSW